MKIPCSVCVINRHQPHDPRKKPIKSTLALCKHPRTQQFCLILFNGKDKTGTKYNITNNIQGVLRRFIHEGKCTIQIKTPEQDLFIQGDPIQVKAFLHLFLRVLENKITDKELTYSSMAVTAFKSKEIGASKLNITKRSEYPDKGFPRTLQKLYINGINRCSLDRGILQLTRLTELNLSDNCIEYLPEELSKLPSLCDLNVSHNLLGKGSLKQWKWIGGALVGNLVSLDLSHNELSFVPEQLSKMNKLAILNLNYNLLNKLPSGIGNMRSLKVLNASNNALVALPGSIKKLRLSNIDVSSNNFIHNIPNGAGVFTNPLSVCSLKEYAGKKVLWARIPYHPENLPRTVIDYLDYSKVCTCGKACFNVYVHHMHMLLLSKIAEEIKSAVQDSLSVPIDCYFCSMRCLWSALYSRSRLVR